MAHGRRGTPQRASQRQRRQSSFFNPRGDEALPGLRQLRKWAEGTKVDVCDHGGRKGYAVIAAVRMRPGTTVAIYDMRVVDAARALPGDCRVRVGRMVGKPDDQSVGPPTDGVARLGQLLNEPATGEAANCERTETKLYRHGTHRRAYFELRTSKYVHKDEELTWDYGESYGRRLY